VVLQLRFADRNLMAYFFAGSFVPLGVPTAIHGDGVVRGQAADVRLRISDLGQFGAAGAALLPFSAIVNNSLTGAVARAPAEVDAGESAVRFRLSADQTRILAAGGAGLHNCIFFTTIGQAAPATPCVAFQAAEPPAGPSDVPPLIQKFPWIPIAAGVAGGLVLLGVGAWAFIAYQRTMLAPDDDDLLDGDVYDSFLEQ
jgi:hypothetical protein